MSLSHKAILLSIAIGIWVLVLQNLGLIGSNKVDARITNQVDARIMNAVEVDNAVDVNLQYINGRRDVFFNNPSRGDNDKYYLIPVTCE
jgi:hypothetical protein